MTVFQFEQMHLFRKPSFLLLCIAVSLITIHLTLAWKSDEADFFGISVLFWLAVSQLVWQRRDSLRLEGSLISTVLSLVLLGIVLFKGNATYGYDYFLRVFPFFSALGLGLLASGIRGLKQYWQELLALFFLAIPPNLVSQLLDASEPTARVSAFFLWYSGFDVVRNGVFVNLPNRGVEVYPGCSGVVQIFYLLGLSVLVLMMFPITGRRKKVSLFLVATLIGFVVNGVRVAIMVILVNAERIQAFDYWHVGAGSNIFSVISVLFFSLFCWYLLRQEELSKGVSSRNNDLGGI